jgi:hypothetical protein
MFGDGFVVLGREWLVVRGDHALNRAFRFSNAALILGRR